MNYLAHAVLAEYADCDLAAAVLGDFMKGVELSSLPPAVVCGVLRHRAVDRATDAHPATARALARLGPRWRRCGRIVLDVWFDHLLIRHWAALGPTDRPERFAACVYRALEGHRVVLPPRLRALLPRMAREDWLSSYGDLANVRRALQGIGRRFRRPQPLADAIPILRAHDGGLERDFLELFPDLVQVAVAAHAIEPDGFAA